MGRGQSRIAARQAVYEAQLERRRERAVRDKELQALAVEVQVCLVEGQARLREAEISAGATLERMITEFGLSTAAAVEWCAGAVSGRDIARLRRLAAAAAAPEQ